MRVGAPKHWLGSRERACIPGRGCLHTLPILAAIMLGHIDPAHAERFDDWELVCAGQAFDKTQDNVKDGANPPADAKPSGGCRLQQAQAVNGGKDVVFLFNVVMQEKRPVAIISAPLNVYLPAGLELRIDGGRPRRAAFETCNISGCHSGFALAKPLVENLQKGRVLTVTIRDSKATQIPIKVSLRGLSAGLQALRGLAK